MAEVRRMPEARHIYVGGPYHGERVEKAAYASSAVRVSTVGRYVRQEPLVDGTVPWLWTEGNE